jgi:PTS system nitrogen regulatory IIA component
MTIADLIAPERIVVGLRVADKAQLLRELSDRAGAALGLEPRIILEALHTRESLGSTGLGKGFALPHARIEQLPGRFVCFARLARPIEFAAIDDRPVDLVVLLLTPANGGNEHLAVLSALSRPLRNQDLLRRLRNAGDAQEMHQLLASA